MHALMFSDVRARRQFTEDYPNKPPAVRFLSHIFHPNVYGDGKICLDILQNQWSPIYDIAAILTSIQSLLSDPNPASPANSEASNLFERDRREYNRRVRAVVEGSWLDESNKEEAGGKEAAPSSASADDAGRGSSSSAAASGSATVFTAAEDQA